jgi:DNA repair protein RadC
MNRHGKDLNSRFLEDMANEHTGHRERLRDRVRKEGLKNFQDYQVLEYVLTFAIPYKDTNEIAHRLINRFGSFYAVLEAEEDELAEVKGMGQASAHFVANLRHIFHYYEADRARIVSKVITPAGAYGYVKPFLVNKLVEEMYVVCLTPKNKIVAMEKISEGTNNEANVSIRLIVEKMNKAKVSSIIVAHNHPKGKAMPSASDDKFTRALTTALAITGCHLLDHIIIGEGKRDYFSYREHALLETYVKEAAELISSSTVAQPCAKYICKEIKKK